MSLRLRIRDAWDSWRAWPRMRASGRYTFPKGWSRWDEVKASLSLIFK